MRPLPSLLACVALLVLPGGFAASEEPAEIPLLAWQELVDHAARHLGKTVRVRAQFHSNVEGWNAYLTRFGPRAFAAFQLWSDEQFPWIESEFELPRVRLFARRGTPGEWGLLGARRHERSEFRVTVRELFLDVPWVEIEAVEPLGEQISEGTSIHAARALELAQKGSYRLALAELEQALSGALPAQAKAELERLRDDFTARAEPQSRR